VKLDGDRSLDRPVEPHLLQVDVRDTAPHGWTWYFENRRVRLSFAVDLDVEDRMRPAAPVRRAPGARARRWQSRPAAVP
jgi:hypothetical protein